MRPAPRRVGREAVHAHHRRGHRRRCVAVDAGRVRPGRRERPVGHQHVRAGIRRIHGRGGPARSASHSSCRARTVHRGIRRLLDGPQRHSVVRRRTATGAACAFVSPAALALVRTNFAEGDQRNRASGFWGAIGSGDAVAANLVGGLPTGFGGWHWVILVNVAIGLIALIAITLLVRPDPAREPGRIDVVGADGSTRICQWSRRLNSPPPRTLRPLTPAGHA
jgi:hypothetical protein